MQFLLIGFEVSNKIMLYVFSFKHLYSLGGHLRNVPN